jgi:hypothetical protein
MEISQLRSGWCDEEKTYVLKGQWKRPVSGVPSGRKFCARITSHDAAG